MTEEDLASHYTTFPTPIMTNYRGVEVWEIPPNGQGLAALIGLSREPGGLGRVNAALALNNLSRTIAIM